MKRLLKNKTINWIIKLVIILLLGMAIYQQVLMKEEVDEIWAQFLFQIKQGNSTWLVLTLLLMPLNWGIETRKWQILLHSFLQIKFVHAFKAIHSGITISLFTPNRVGEYGGRILQVDAKYNWQAVVATLVGSLAQLVALLTCGLIGFIYFALRFLEAEMMVLSGVFLIGLTFLVLLFIGFFNIDLFIPLARRIKFLQQFKRYLRHLKLLKKYSNEELFIILGLSFLRYLTYSTQFFFMLRFFGIEASYLEALSGISTIFLVQTSIPLPPVLGLLARGEVALLVWGYFGGNEISVLAATYGIFVINLILPALLGLVFIVQTNVLKSLGYENNTD